jgi:ABC-type hemin transport system ATPase subunit
MVGVARPSQGQVIIDGRDVTAGKSAQALIGYVPQAPSLPGLAKVRDIVAYAAWLSGVEAVRAEGAVEAALSKMQVLDLASRRIRTLSGGQRQRVALATGIVHGWASYRRAAINRGGIGTAKQVMIVISCRDGTLHGATHPRPLAMLSSRQVHVWKME